MGALQNRQIETFFGVPMRYVLVENEENLFMIMLKRFAFPFVF